MAKKISGFYGLRIRVIFVIYFFFFEGTASQKKDDGKNADIDLVVSQTKVSRAEAADALKKQINDIVEAIMALTELKG